MLTAVRHIIIVSTVVTNTVVERLIVVVTMGINMAKAGARVTIDIPVSSAPIVTTQVPRMQAVVPTIITVHMVAINTTAVTLTVNVRAAIPTTKLTVQAVQSIVVT